MLNFEFCRVTKRCSKCGLVKHRYEFTNKKQTSDGLNSNCKLCDKKYREHNRDRITEYGKEYRKANKKNKALMDKIYRQKNKDRIAKRKKQYAKDNAEHISVYQKEYKTKFKSNIAEQGKQYREQNKDKIKSTKKQYYEMNQDNILKKKREFRINNKDKIATQKRESYYRNKKHIVEKQKEYLLTDSGKNSKAKVQARRRNDYGYTMLNRRFEGCEGHHIDNNIVVFIPAELHKMYPHRQSNLESMIEINKVALEYMCISDLYNVENYVVY